jgi:hypothetical protein
MDITTADDPAFVYYPDIQFGGDVIAGLGVLGAASCSNFLLQKPPTSPELLRRYQGKHK